MLWKDANSLFLAWMLSNFLTQNIGTPKTITIMKPTVDKDRRTFYTYIGHDQMGSERRRLEIVPHGKSTVTTLLADVISSYDINLTKKVHRYGHARESELISLFKDAGILTQPLALACKKVVTACDACQGSERRGIKTKISLSHVNKAFNEKIHVDFATVRFKDVNYEILNIVDTGTKYGLCLTVPDRPANTIKKILERYWFFEFGAPRSLNADLKFTRGVMEEFLQLHNVILHQRPERSSNKNGIVERQNGVFNMVMERLSKHDKTSDVEEVVARSSLFTNLIKGSNVLSSFQLAKGYSPSILGMSRNFVPQELLDAHIEITAARTIQKILKTKTPRVERRSALTLGKEVRVYLRTKKPEPVSWIKAKVEEAQEHLVKCRRSNNGTPMLVSDEDIRLRSKGELTRALMSQNITEEIDIIDTAEKISPDNSVDDGLESNDENIESIDQITHNTSQPNPLTHENINSVVADSRGTEIGEVPLEQLEKLQYRPSSDTDSESGDDSNQINVDSMEQHITTTSADEQNRTDHSSELGITELAKSLPLEPSNDDDDDIT